MSIQTGKTTVIRRIVVRETSVSRHHRDRIEAPLKPIGLSQHYCIEGFKGDLYWSPIRPTDASLLDSNGIFSSIYDPKHI